MLIAAGLVAKKAVEKGLKVKPWVKTSLAPGSQVVTDYLKAAKLDKGSKAPGRDKAGKVTQAQIKEIAEQKMKDLNCDTVEAAAKMIEGSARSMGREVVGG